MRCALHLSKINYHEIQLIKKIRIWATSTTCILGLYLIWTERHFLLWCRTMNGENKLRPLFKNITDNYKESEIFHEGNQWERYLFYSVHTKNWKTGILFCMQKVCSYFCSILLCFSHENLLKIIQFYLSICMLEHVQTK